MVITETKRRYAIGEIRRDISSRLLTTDNIIHHCCRTTITQARLFVNFHTDNIFRTDGNNLRLCHLHTINQELIRRMSEIVDGHVPVDSLLHWEDLYQTIDYIYEGFYTRIKEKYGNLLNEKELQLCCLLKANFSTKEISIVSGQGVRTVYQRKSVIRQKLGMEEKGDIVEFLS